MKNLSLVTFLTAIFGSLMVMAQVMQDRSYYKSHHGGIHSLYPGFGGMYGGHHPLMSLMSHNMYGLGGYGMGHHGYGMGHHGYGMGHHGYGHHSVGHYGMPPTFIPVMGAHKSSYGHIPYSPLMALLGNHHGGQHGGMYGR